MSTRGEYDLALPPGSACADLGPRAEVAARVAACLPGVSFDTQGRAVLERPAYRLTFSLAGPEDQATLRVQLEGGPPALVALRRLEARTGWRLVPVEGRPAAPGEVHGAPTGSVAPRPWREAAWGLAIAALLTLAASLALRQPPERRALDDVRAVAAAEAAFAAWAAAYVDVDTLATPALLPELVTRDLPSRRFLPERFRKPVRGGYRFEFQGLSPTSSVRLELPRPAFAAYAYAAVPVSGHGRTFACYSHRPGVVYARDDGRVPTPDDTIVATR